MLCRVNDEKRKRKKIINMCIDLVGVRTERKPNQILWSWCKKPKYLERALQHHHIYVHRHKPNMLLLMELVLSIIIIIIIIIVSNFLLAIQCYLLLTSKQCYLLGSRRHRSYRMVEIGLVRKQSCFTKHTHTLHNPSSPH